VETIMKTLFKAALAATAATGLFASPAFAAQPSATSNFTAKAKIVKAITIAKNSDLDFGTITMLSTLVSQTVKVGQDDSRACGGANLTCSFPVGAAAANFTVTGVPNQALNVTLAAPTDLNDVNGYLVAFRPSFPANVTVAAGGTVSFGIGGEIDVVSATKDGSYSGDLTVTVTYQ
jgi:hypothetical protein